MRDKVKRFISILMTALMLVNLMPVGALADGITSIGYQQSTVEDYDKTVYVYVEVTGNLNGLKLNNHGWCTVGKVTGLDMPNPQLYDGKGHMSNVSGYSASSVGRGVHGFNPFDKNQSINRSNVTWSGGKYGFVAVNQGADDYVPNGWTWHLDGYIDILQVQSSYKIRYVDQDTDEVLDTPVSGIGKPGTSIKHTAPRTLDGGYEIVDKPNQTFILEQVDNTFDIRYRRKYAYAVEYYYDDVKDTSKTVTGSKWCGEKITQYADKSEVGYELDETKTTKLPLTIGTDESKNVIKVYYKKIGYTVTYEPGEHGAFDIQKHDAKYNDGTPAFKGETTGDPGWKFAGWEPEVADTVKGDATYTAQWEADPNVTAKIKYEVYEGQNGFGNVNPGAETIQAATGNLTSGDPLEGSTATAHKGYKFEGWYKVEGNDRILVSENPVLNGPTVFNALTKGKDNLYKDALFWAKFVPDENEKVTVTYEAVNGTVTHASDTILQADASGLTGSTAVAATGYKFDGWYNGTEFITKELNLTPETAKPKLNKDGNLYAATTFTAKFVPDTDLKATVTYEAVNGTVDNASDKIVQADASGLTGSTATANTGYKFDGWYVKDNDTPISGLDPAEKLDAGTAKKNLNKDGNLYAATTFVAKFVPDTDLKATVTYEAINGRVDNASDEIVQADASGLTGSTATANTGYKFDGWYVKDNDTPISGLDPAENLDAKTAKEKLKKDGNLYAATTFVAKFVPDTKQNVKVIYTTDGNGMLDNSFGKVTQHVQIVTGEVVKADGSVSRPELTPVSANAPSAGYVFDHWVKVIDADNLQRIGGASFELKDEQARPLLNKAADGLYQETEFRAIFTPRTDLSYTVNYLEKGTNNVLHKAKTVENKTFKDVVNSADEVITIEGYTYDSASLDTLTIGTDVSKNVINLYYTKNSYKLTINYVYENGTLVEEDKLKPNPYTQTLDYGTEYWVKSPSIYGYTVDKPVVEGKLTENTTETVTYRKRTDLSYMVNYYWNGTTDEVAESKTVNNQTFEAEVTEHPVAAEGYTPVSTDPKKITIDANSANNVITFYYYKNVELTANSDTVTYDGKDHSVSGFTGKTVKEEETVTLSFDDVNVPEVKQKDAGTYPVAFNKDPADKVDTTGKYIVKAATNGQLVINKRLVTLASETASKTYDGTPLTRPNVTMPTENNQGFIASEIKELKATGSVTNVADSPVTNTIVYELKDGYSLNNYEIISKDEGKLSITPVTAEVLVEITGNTASVTYDGQLHKVEGYVASSISNSLYKDSDFTYNGDAKAEGTDATTYPMNLAETRFENTNTNFKNVRFEVVEDGQLVINPRPVVLISADLTKVYDGTALTNGDTPVTEMFGTENAFPEGEGLDYTFTGSQTLVGSSANTFTYKPNDNTKADNYTFEVKFGTLEVTPVTDKVTVTIKGGKSSVTYNGEEHTVSGYKVADISNPLYTANDFSFSGTAEANGKNAGTYKMGLKAADFANTSNNFKNVEFVVADGQLEITKRPVMLTSADLIKVYDGTPLKNGDTPVKEEFGTEDAFPEGEGVTYTFKGSQTNAGSSKNMFTYAWNEGTNKDNYTIYQVEGDLVVTPIDGIKVTITGHKDTQTYDGKEHSVFGFDAEPSNALYNPKEDMQFNGTDVDMIAKGTDAGQYNIGLTAEHFTNKSNNFTNVTFVVTDGYVKITPRAVTLTSETAGKTYDGTALEKPVVTVGGDGFVEGQVKEIKATGSVTNAGSVANTITFTPNKETFKDGNYSITKNEGTLTIAKRSVLIASQSATKTYDGEALTRPAVTITGDGFVPGELAKAEATGSITKVGSTPNTIQYTTTGAFNAANYSIALSVGTLTVTEKPQPEPRRTFNLTINYVYQNGKRAASSYNRGGLKNGETFDITSPVIAGYTASETVVSGTIYNRDIKVTVIYTADGVNLDDYGVPLGLGNITMNVGDCFE